ncbi:MAG: hypothetical protein GX601_09330 [Anaerolineales bacterium]|jgi:chromosome segregation ATPase|nr:hypothetical protein [Anaerolineales bacterium]
MHHEELWNEIYRLKRLVADQSGRAKRQEVALDDLQQQAAEHQRALIALGRELQSCRAAVDLLLDEYEQCVNRHIALLARVKELQHDTDRHSNQIRDLQREVVR